MGARDHGGNPVGIHRVVDLDLDEIAGIGIGVDGGNGLRLAIDQDAIIGAERALPLDKAAAEDAWSGQLARFNAVDQGAEHLVIIAHIAHAGDAGGDVEHGTGLAHMRVHFEQAGDERSATAVDLDLTGSGWHIERINGSDPLALDHDRDRGAERLGGRVEDAHIADPHRGAVIMRRA